MGLPTSPNTRPTLPDTRPQQQFCGTERSNCMNQTITGCMSGILSMGNSSINIDLTIEDLTKQYDCACETAKSFATW